MGYGEFDDSGSVKWEVVHDNGEEAIADPEKKRANGKDKVSKEGNVFRIYVDGTLLETVKMGKPKGEKTTVKIEWNP